MVLNALFLKAKNQPEGAGVKEESEREQNDDEESESEQNDDEENEKYGTTTN